MNDGGRDAARIVRILLSAQAMRGLGYGVAAVQLGAILRLGGLSPSQVGLLLAAIVAGSLVASLVLARWGDRHLRWLAGRLHRLLAGAALRRHYPDDRDHLRRGRRAADRIPARRALAGLAQGLGLAWPFLLAGTAKIGYDLALWRLFRPVRLPAERHDDTPSP